MLPRQDPLLRLLDAAKELVDNKIDKPPTEAPSSTGSIPATSVDKTPPEEKRHGFFSEKSKKRKQPLENTVIVDVPGLDNACKYPARKEIPGQEFSAFLNNIDALIARLNTLATTGKKDCKKLIQNCKNRKKAFLSSSMYNPKTMRYVVEEKAVNYFKQHFETYSITSVAEAVPPYKLTP